jgi:hypothetical protein
MAAVAREVGVDALLNVSQMTVSQMSIQNTTPSPQQRQHWLSSTGPVPLGGPDDHKDHLAEEFSEDAHGLLARVSVASQGARSLIPRRTDMSAATPLDRIGVGIERLPRGRSSCASCRRPPPWRA